MKNFIKIAIAALLPGVAHAQYISVPGVGWEGQGADVEITNLDRNPRPDLILMAYDNPSRSNNFRYRVGKNVDANGRTLDWTTRYIRVPGVGWEGAGAGLAVGNLDGNSRPDMILMAYDDPNRANTFRYRVGKNLDSNGNAASWSTSFITVPGVGWEGQGADVLLTNLDSNPRPDMLLMAYDNPSRSNSFRYKIGRNLDQNGVTSDWTTGHITVPGVGWEGQGAGMAIANLDSDPRPDLIMMAYDNPRGANSFRYRIGYNLNANGIASRWQSSYTTEPGVGWEGAGAGIAVGDLNGNSQPDLLFMAYDSPARSNNFRYRIKRDFGNIVRNLYVRRYIGSSLSNADADRILADASTLLQTKDGPSDVPTPLVLRRGRGVDTFSTGDGSINTRTEFTTISSLAGDAKVVNSIQWCGGPGSSIIGCANRPGSSFLVVRFSADREGILWAHEFGHNQGNPHRSGSVLVMNPSITGTAKQVNATESGRFLGPLSATVAGAMAANASTSGESLDQAMIEIKGEPEPAIKLVEVQATGLPTPPSIEEFVETLYFEGLPFAQAAQYGEDDVPALIAILKDDEKRYFWANAVTVLGIIGGDEAAQTLISFVDDAQGKDLSPEAYRAALDATLSLGYLVNRDANPDAINYLAAKASGITTEAATTGTESGATGDGLQLDPGAMASSAILGLSLAGRPETRAVLEDLTPPQSATGTESGEADSTGNLIAEALEVHNSVEQLGLSGYYSQR